MMQGLTGWHLLIILAIILLLFGAARLPALAKSMGQSARALKSEIKEMKNDETSTPDAAHVSSVADARVATASNDPALPSLRD